MYNKDITDRIAGMLGLNAEEFAKGITSEQEVDLTLPSGRFLTQEQEDTIKDNHGKTRYDVGRTAEREIVYKDLSREIGLEKPIKNHKDFVEAYKNLIIEEAKIEPNKKIEEYQNSISNLQGVIKERDSKIHGMETEFKGRQMKLDAKAFIPEIPETLGITKDDATNLFFMSHEVKEDGIYKNGSILKDTLETPIDLKEAVSSFVSEKGWNKKPAGRGGGAGGKRTEGVAPKTEEEFEAMLKEKGISPSSQEANALLTKYAKENPEILD